MGTWPTSARGTGLPGADLPAHGGVRGTGKPPLPPAAGRHIVLVGLPGAGKSAVAPRLAAALGRPVHDLDAEIVRREGRSIAAIFAERGESGFRELEHLVTREVLSGEPSVIATGGGWVLTEANWEAASTTALVIHLQATPATAWRRIATDCGVRPLLAVENPEQRLADLEATRRERYARADVVLDTEVLDVEAVVRSLARLIDRSAPG